LPFVAKIVYNGAHLPAVTTNHLGGGSFLCNSNEELCAFFQNSYWKAIKVVMCISAIARGNGPKTHISDYTLIAANMITLHKDFKIMQQLNEGCPA
jgi:hypothetical protein